MAYLNALFVYVLATSLFYLGAFAKITYPIHTRYPWRLYRFMSCPACAGFWYSAAVTSMLLWGSSYGLPGHGYRYHERVIAMGLCGIFMVSVLWSLMLFCLGRHEAFLSGNDQETHATSEKQP